MTSKRTSAEHPFSKRLLLVICSLLTLALIPGCGGGGSSLFADGGVGSGGTGITMGTVNGFGSVIVDGQRISDAGAAVEAESEPGSANKAGQDESIVKLGQQVVVENDANATMATRIHVHPTLIGVVDSVDLVNQRLVIAGQDVRLVSDSAGVLPTALDGLESLADLSTGDRLEVHGHIKRDPLTSAYYIAATRIERRVGSQAFVRVSAIVTAFDATAKTLQLGNLHVAYDSSVKMIPASATLAVGRRVVAWSDQAITGGVLQAKTIAVLQPNYPSRYLRVGGVVADCTNAGACANGFSVSGVTVDASEATFTGAGAAALADGVYVRVIGRANASGVLKASRVVFRASNDNDVTLIGTVTSYVDNQSFKVRGVPVTTDTNTVIDGACALAAGQPVLLKGAVQGNKVLAQTVTCLSALDGITLDLRGVASNLNTFSQTLRVNGLLAAVPVSYASATFSDGAANTLTNGQYLEVHGQVSAGVLKAESITFGTAPVGSQFDTVGLVYALQSTQFRLNGLLIHFNSGVIAGGGTLQNGQRVRVRMEPGVSGTFQALNITPL